MLLFAMNRFNFTLTNLLDPLVMSHVHIALWGLFEKQKKKNVLGAWYLFPVIGVTAVTKIRSFPDANKTPCVLF